LQKCRESSFYTYSSVLTAIFAEWREYKGFSNDTKDFSCSSNFEKKNSFCILFQLIRKIDTYMLYLAVLIEIISCIQILEAREELLQNSPIKNKTSHEGTEGSGQSSENRNDPHIQPEDKEPSPSSIQNTRGISETPSIQEPTSDPKTNIEAEKHPISTTEAEIIDKLVIQEELVMKNEKEYTRREI
jgi:hypothetical protein